MKDKLWQIFFWVFGTIMFAFILCLIPGALVLLAEIFYYIGEICHRIGSYAYKFFDLSLVIKVPILLILGLYLNYLNLSRDK